VVEEITIKKIPVKDILFDETNPNELTDEQMGALKETMNKFGYLVPVILNKNMDIIDGEHRVRVYQELGKKTIPAYVIDVDNTDKKILRQLMNKLKGIHDKTKDAQEFKLIFEAGKLNEFSKLLAKPMEDFQSILEKKFDIEFEREEEDEVPEAPEKPKAKLGDIYQLGRHRIMCGDSTKELNLLLEGKTVDQLLTDPPYGVNYAEKNRYLDSIGKGNTVKIPILHDNIENYREFFGNFLKVIPFSKYNTVYVFLVGKHVNDLTLAFEDSDINWTTWLVWAKNNHVLGRMDYATKHELILYGWKGQHKFYGGFQTSVLEYDKPLKSDLHPTMKPIELLCQLIKDGTEKDMLVYDPFLGSGSTLIACEQTDRICYGMELDPGYVDVIIQRWENYTGEKAKKIVL
jgi:DNA modification methylase